jgi:tRNA(Ile)-lysidine synthase
MTAEPPHLQQRIVEFLRTRHLLASGTHMLVAASGGLDSTVLAHVASRIAAAWKGKLTLATVHHGLRPEAESEISFVRALAKELGAEFRMRRVDVSGEMLRSGVSLQDAARLLRYRALEEMCDETGASVILTAHHADDQAETLLAHFLRGAGPDGLSGIRPVRGRVARPMLGMTRDEILAWARIHDLAWMEDPSNQRDDYRRNAIRHHVSPAVTKVFGEGWVRALGNDARLFGLLGDFLREHGAHLAERCMIESGDELRILRNSLNDSTEFEKLYACRIALQKLRGTAGTFEEQFSLLQLFDASPGATVQLREGAAAIRDPEGLRLFLASTVHDPVHVAVGQVAHWDSWRLAAEELGAERPAYSADPFDELIDLERAGDSWQLRQWTADDRFEPLGFGREKHVGRFLADSGFPAARRARIPVLEGPLGIVWVCGVRLAQSAALRADSRRIGRIHFFTTDIDDA